MSEKNTETVTIDTLMRDYEKLVAYQDRLYKADKIKFANMINHVDKKLEYIIEHPIWRYHVKHGL